MSNKQITELTKKWIEIKAAETAANKARIEIERELVTILGVKPEGSETHTVDDFTITITGKMSRSLDIAVWESIKNDIEQQLRPVIYKPSIDLKGLRYIQNNEPAVYKKVAEAITTKPAKPSLTIKESS